MKDLIRLSILAIALSLGNTAFAATVSDEDPKELKMGNKPLPGGGFGQGPHKTPGRNVCPVSVNYYEDLCQLSLSTAAAPSSVAYMVYDASGNAVLSGIPAFIQGTANIDLSALAAGTYYLQLTVNGQDYFGEFDL